MGWQNPTIIAELGENAFPFSMVRLTDLIGVAAVAGAHAIKVQLYRADHFPKAEQLAKANTEFPRHRVRDLVALAHAEGLLAGVSVFDPEAIKVAQDAGVDFIKLATREQSNVQLLTAVLDSGAPNIFRSVDWREVLAGHSVITYDWADVITLACISEYPTALTTVHTDRLSSLMADPFGWSSHTTGWVDCVEAVRQGACVIEKHLCLDPSDPEGLWSLPPGRFEMMVHELAQIRALQTQEEP